jgi:hypothetical protein
MVGNIRSGRSVRMKSAASAGLRPMRFSNMRDSSYIRRNILIFRCMRIVEGYA